MLSPAHSSSDAAHAALFRRLILAAAFVTLCLGIAAWVRAAGINSDEGPIASMTGAPEIAGIAAESNCTLCHQDFLVPCDPPCNLDTPGGGVAILDLPATYLPGVAIPMRVRMWTDSTLAYPDRLWGFQITSIRSSDGKGAGDWIAPADTFLVQSGLGSYASRRYLSQMVNGIRAGLGGPIEWSFTWTPPAGNEGWVYFAAASVAANGNDEPGPGDFVFTTIDSIAPDPTPTVPVSWGALKRRYR